MINCGILISSFLAVKIQTYFGSCIFVIFRNIFFFLYTECGASIALYSNSPHCDHAPYTSIAPFGEHTLYMAVAPYGDGTPLKVASRHHVHKGVKHHSVEAEVGWDDWLRSPDCASATRP